MTGRIIAISSGIHSPDATETLNPNRFIIHDNDRFGFNKKHLRELYIYASDVYLYANINTWLSAC